MTTGGSHGEKTSIDTEIGRLRGTLDRVAQIVNDLNNLLTVMRGHAQLAYEDPSEKNSQELIRVVLTSTSRAQRQIREAFGRSEIDAPGGAAAAESARKARILVVDDEQLVRDLMQQILGKSGHEVKVAGNPDAAIAACKGKAYDIIFMDIRLGKAEDGISVFRKIRELQPDSHVVFLSGDPNIESVWQKVRNEGADGFIKKPFDISEIDGVVYRILAFPGAPED